jgi:hypothetical protein
MTYQLANAKIWNGTAWVSAAADYAFGFANSVYNPTAFVTPTASATIHTKGAWTQVVASTAGAIDLLKVLFNSSTSGAATGSLLDIGVGAAGSEVVIVSNVGVGSASQRYTANNECSVMLIPVPTIAAGSRIAVRVQSVVVSKGVGCWVNGYYTGQPANSVTTYGTNTATSTATGLGTAWTQITAATSAEHRVLSCVVSGSSTAINGLLTTVTVGYGPSGSEVTLGAFPITTNNIEIVSMPVGVELSTLMRGVPSGSRLVAKLGTTVHCQLTIMGIS